MTPRKAKLKLADLMADVRAGRWIPPEQRAPEVEVPSFHELASEWFAELAKLGGRRGKGLSERSIRDLRDWRLKEHILPTSPPCGSTGSTLPRSIASGCSR